MTQAELATHTKAFLVQAEYLAQRRGGLAWMLSPTRTLVQCCATRESRLCPGLEQEMNAFLQGRELQVV